MALARFVYSCGVGAWTLFAVVNVFLGNPYQVVYGVMMGLMFILVLTVETENDDLRRSVKRQADTIDYLEGELYDERTYRTQTYGRVA